VILPGGSGYFTCKQNMKVVTTKFKSGGLHEKYVVATWNVGNHLSICWNHLYCSIKYKIIYTTISSVLCMTIC